MTERRADDATRDVEAWLKCFYMQDRVGEEFPGTISSVTGFGIFVALDDIYVEGLVHISELGSDYFHFDKARHQILGERTGTRYRMGDRVQVKIVRVSLDTARIDFTLAGGSRPAQTATQDQPHGGGKQPKKSATGKQSHPQPAAAAGEPAKKSRRRRKSGKGAH